MKKKGRKNSVNDTEKRKRIWEMVHLKKCSKKVCKEDKTTTIPELVLKGWMKGRLSSPPLFLQLTSKDGARCFTCGWSPPAPRKEREREKKKRTTAGKTEEAEEAASPSEKIWIKMQNFLKRQMFVFFVCLFFQIRAFWEAKTEVRSGAYP